MRLRDHFRRIDTDDWICYASIGAGGLAMAASIICTGLYLHTLSQMTPQERQDLAKQASFQPDISVPAGFFQTSPPPAPVFR